MLLGRGRGACKSGTAPLNELCPLQIGVSVAGDPSSQLLEKLSVFCSQPGYIFTALVSPHKKRDAAEYCSKRLEEAST